MANLTNVLDKAYEGKDFAELAEALVDALQDLWKANAGALEKALGIKTVRYLVTKTFVLWAQAINIPARIHAHCVYASRAIKVVQLMCFSVGPAGSQSVNSPRRAASVTASVRLAAPSLVMIEET